MYFYPFCHCHFLHRPNVHMYTRNIDRAMAASDVFTFFSDGSKMRKLVGFYLDFLKHDSCAKYWANCFGPFPRPNSKQYRTRAINVAPGALVKMQRIWNRNVWWISRLSYLGSQKTQRYGFKVNIHCPLVPILLFAQQISKSCLGPRPDKSLVLRSSSWFYKVQPLKHAQTCQASLITCRGDRHWSKI